MNLENLYSKIELLKNRIKSHRSTLSSNEWRTRAVLIDPLLKDLGWDVSDPNQVIVEYSAISSSIDYALFIENHSMPFFLIEAKKLDEQLERHQEQIVNYAIRTGIKYIGLTNGDRWEVFDVSRQGEIERKKILNVSLLATPTNEIVFQLLLLWNRNSESGSLATEVGTPIVPGEDGPGHDWVSLSEFRPSAKMKRPVEIKFWDGTQNSAHFWYDLLLLVVEKMYNEEKFTYSDLPIKSSGRTNKYLINLEPIHANGEEFIQPKEIGTLVVNTHYGRDAIVENTRMLLNRFGPDPSKVFIKPR